MNCQIEFVSSDRDNGMPCGKPVVTKCSDCGVAICSDCRLECCGDSFCEPCYDYHVTHSCVKRPVQNERNHACKARNLSHEWSTERSRPHSEKVYWDLTACAVV